VTYTVPKVDVVVSGTFHSLPYPGNNFPSVANQSLGGVAVASPLETTLGRPFSNGQAVTFLNLVKPGALYGDRLNQIDFRVAKLLKLGRGRAMIGVDLFNALNAASILTYNNTFVPGGTWLQPSSVLTARMAKISAEVTF